jgi:predicted HAD superfamily Cof-like phosphohydrolase
MQNAIDDVKAFHVACDVPVATKPCIPPTARKELRWSLIEEEINKELVMAMAEENIPAIADAIADGIYVLIGTALEYGIPLAKVWNAVQDANMAKVDATTGKVIRRPDGKILKPDGWQPPDITRIIADAMV